MCGWYWRRIVVEKWGDIEMNPDLIICEFVGDFYKALQNSIHGENNL
jgi:hypothetical protein